MDSPNQSTGECGTSGDSTIKVGQELLSSERTDLDTQSLLAMLMDGTTVPAEIANQSITHVHHTVNKADLVAQDVNKLISRSLGSSSGQIKRAKYVSPVRECVFSILLILPLFYDLEVEIFFHLQYPTGRVSFKLYDWNPADFPRRLRQQVRKIQLLKVILNHSSLITNYLTLYLIDI